VSTRTSVSACVVTSARPAADWLTEAQLHKCREKLADVLRVLGEERETWRQLSERFAGDDDARAPLPPREIPAPTMLAPPPSTTSFSFEA
jgi:hypothetical protein